MIFYVTQIDGSDEMITHRVIKLNDVYDHMAHQGMNPKIDLEES